VGEAKDRGDQEWRGTTARGESHATMSAGHPTVAVPELNVFAQLEIVQEEIEQDGGGR